MLNTTTERLEVTVYKLSPSYESASRWLETNRYQYDQEFASLVLDWVGHQSDYWSVRWSQEQHMRVDIISDWIEEHNGERRWTTAMMIEV